jgi:hypothetical protein
MASYTSDPLFGNDISSGVSSPSAGELLQTFTTVSIYQRVYSTGLSQWCYYVTADEPNASPAPTLTSPNWTGSISNHQVLARV